MYLPILIVCYLQSIRPHKGMLNMNFKPLQYFYILNILTSDKSRKSATMTKENIFNPNFEFCEPRFIYLIYLIQKQNSNIDAVE